MQSSTPRSQVDARWQVLTITAILATLGVNILSNFFPWGGLNIGQIANTLFADVMITPANYAFAIWGLIYLGIVAFGIYQLQPHQQQNRYLQTIRPLIVGACLTQILWVFAFLGRQFWLSVVLMFGILALLIRAYVRSQQGNRISRQEKWLVQIPISIYLGWISVASVVNVASALDAVNWDGWNISASIWTVVMLAITTGITAILTIRRHEGIFPLVVIWAFVAIAIRQVNQPLVLFSALGFTAVLLLLTIVALRHAYPRLFSRSL
jgi:hypothetical protein